MANEDDSVKSSSFAIFIIYFQFTDSICHIPGETLEHGFYPEMKHRCAFSQKRICIYQKSASFTYYVSGTKNS